jgi:hypothetical protein
MSSNPECFVAAYPAGADVHARVMELAQIFL